MSINLNRPIVPTLVIEMINGRTRLIGIPKQKIQVIMTLPDIKGFNKELGEAIKFFKDRAEAFIITSSSKENCHEVMNKYELEDNILSKDYKDFSKIFEMQNSDKSLKKSLIIIDTNCQITHKDIL